MKHSRFSGIWPALLIATWSCFAPLHAQISVQPVPPPVQMDSQKLNAEELGQLLAPIALYPDALIALILPASTVPPDVVMAARYLKAGGDPEQTESQPWEESVKSLTRYPAVLAWMDENLEWTSSVGEAFTAQPADVMSAIQALREQARAAGNLVDSPQQKVVEEEEVIRIVPADPQVIYVPQYDPQVVYVQSFSTVPVLTFGIGFAVGSWLCYDFDWRQRCFYRGNWCGWNPDWRDNRNHRPDGNRCATVNVDPRNASQWQPSAGARRQAVQRQHNNTGNARYISARPATPDAVGQQDSPPNGPNARPAAAYSPERKTALPRPTKWEHPTSSNGRPTNPATPSGKFQPPHAKQPEPPAPDTSSPGNTARPQRDGHPTLPPPCPVAPDRKPAAPGQTVDKPQAPTSVPPTTRPRQPAPDITTQSQPARGNRQEERVQPRNQPQPVAEPQTASPQRPAPVAQPQHRKQPPTTEPVQQQRPAPVVQPQLPQSVPVQQSQPRMVPPTTQPVQQQRPAPVQPQVPAQQAPNPRRSPGGR